MKILFVVPCNPYFPSGIVRAMRYFPYLDSLNIEYKWINFNGPYVQKWLHSLDISIISRNKFIGLFLRYCIHLCGIPYRWFRLIQIFFIAKHFDLLFLQAIIPPVWYTKLLRKIHRHIVYDFDDALYLRHAARTQACIRNAWQVIAGSHILIEYAKQYNNQSFLLPSCIPLEKYPSSGMHQDHNPIRIGWIGGDSTLEQLIILENPLRELISKQYNLEFLVAGSRNLPIALRKISGLHIIEIPEYNDEEIPFIAHQIDIGVMPLYDLPKEQGKCGLKVLIYMAAGLPTISSSVGEVKNIIEHGINGFLAESEEDWILNLENLINSKELRNKLGSAGIQSIKDSYSADHCFQILKENIIDRFMIEIKSDF